MMRRTVLLPYMAREPFFTVFLLVPFSVFQKVLTFFIFEDVSKS